MEEPTRNEQQQAESAPEAPAADAGAEETKAAVDELLDELSKLATRVADVVQAAWNSDERKHIEADLRSGLASVTSSLEEGFHKLGERQETKELVAKAENVTEKVRTSKVTNELADALVKGLRAVGNQLETWAEQLQKREAEAAAATPSAAPEETKPADAEAQEIPIDKA